MKKFRVLVLFVFGIMAIAATQNQATADSNWPFAQINCVPELNYFVFRSARLWDVGPNSDQQGRLLQARLGLFGLEDLIKNPQKCKTTAFKIEVSATDIPHDAFNCQTWAFGTYHVVVSRDDGSTVFKTTLNVDAGTCDDDRTNIVEVTQFGIRQCVVKGSDDYGGGQRDGPLEGEKYCISNELPK